MADKLQITGIHPGDKFKNYQELCAALGIPVKSGNSKTFQLKELSDHFSWKRCGHSYIITEVYEQPPEPVIKLADMLSTKQKYNALVEVILLTELLKAKNHIICCTKSNLYKTLGFINNNYGNLEFEKAFISELDIESGDISYLKSIIFNKISIILYYTTDKLAKHNFINYESNYMISTSENTVLHLANATEKQQIELISAGVMESLGIVNLNQAQAKNIMGIYSKKIRPKLEARGFMQTIPVIRLEYTAQPYTVEPLTDKELLSAKKKLNRNFRNNLLATLKEHYKADRKEFLSKTIKKLPQNRFVRFDVKTFEKFAKTFFQSFQRL